MALSAWWMASSCAGECRCAASAAASPSIPRRSSVTRNTASIDPLTSRSMVNALMCAPSLTTVPLPWRTSTRPADLRREIASRMTVLLTPKRSDSTGSVGRRAPGSTSPLAI
ncbi:hypothetical protein D3C84_871260 [compost metagenome]